MLLPFTFLSIFLIFQLVSNQPSDPSHNFSVVNYSFGEELRLYRARREDRLKHQAICGELDKTEDTHFVAVIITKNPGRLLCMGSIIDEYHVLTAKNCLNKSDAATLMIIGGYQSPYFGRNSQVKFAARIMKHEMDLATIRLTKPFTITTTVKPIKIIGPEKMNDDIKGTYKDSDGKDVYGIVGYTVPKHLERADYLPKPSAYIMLDDKLNEDTCSNCYTSPKADYDFCTEGNGNFSWAGVGSPTFIIREKQFIQIGLVTRGKCTESSYPPEPVGGKPQDLTPYLHLRIDKFHHWIKANSYIGR